VTREARLFVPAFPTIRPEALLRPGDGASLAHYPFSAPSARYFYFARNAIWQVVKLLGLEGGEVLVPAYHHGVEIEALIDAGARVRFYRIGPQCQLDLGDVARRIGPQTKALYLTHFFGFPGPVREMRELARTHGLPLIEDCALALFSADGELPLGVTGDVGIFCLYKVLAVPDGGILVRRGERDASAGGAPPAASLAAPPLASSIAVAASSMLRNLALRGGGAGRAVRRLVLGLGKRALSASRVEPVLAGTQHFDRRHANLGVSRLTRHLLRVQDVPTIVSRRRSNYLFLQERLRELSAPLYETLPAGVVPLCYPLLVDDNRRVMERLVARGIEAVDFWREGHPACDLSGFADVARLRTSVLEVPCHQDLTLETLEAIADEIRDVLAPSQARLVLPRAS
jgi:perosamine synthetase